MTDTYFQQLIKQSWRDFIKTDIIPDQIVRPEIIESWIRSKQWGVNPYLRAPVSTLSKEELDIKREKNSQADRCKPVSY